MLILAILAVSSSAYAKKTGEKNVPDYFIEGAGTGVQGTYLVNVTVIVNKTSQADDDAIGRAAVHGVLFKGFSSKEFRQSQKPLAGSAANEASHADYYSSFFQPGGAALNYVDIVESSRKVKKVNKLYHITATVTVNMEQLRKDLEEAGVIRGLNSAF